METDNEKFNLEWWKLIIILQVALKIMLIIRTPFHSFDKKHMFTCCQL